MKVNYRNSSSPIVCNAPSADGATNQETVQHLVRSVHSARNYTTLPTCAGASRVKQRRLPAGESGTKSRGMVYHMEQNDTNSVSSTDDVPSLAIDPVSIEGVKKPQHGLLICPYTVVI